MPTALKQVDAGGNSLKTDLFLVNCCREQMYSNGGDDGGGLCLVLEMCFVNCAATRGCADGNISAPAELFTKALLSSTEAAVGFRDRRPLTA